MSDLNLFAANAQWSTRPADERFWSPAEALEQCRYYADHAEELEVDFGEFPLMHDGGDIVLSLDGGKGVRSAKITNWAFSQLARTANAPADYLRKLPAPLAIQCVEAGLDAHFSGRDKMTRQALVHSNGSTVLRSLTSDRYSRFWNWKIFERLVGLESQGWRVPPARPAAEGDPRARPATKADVLRFGRPGDGLQVKVGDMIAPAGIYASDHDMFAFMVNEDIRTDDGTEGGLSRGFFVRNSEVGASSLWVQMFDYRSVCGNHIVWGAEDVVEINLRHVGEIEGRFTIELAAALEKYGTKSGKGDKDRVKRAKTTVLGKTDDEVLDAVFKLVGKTRKTGGLPSGLNAKMLGEALATAKTFEHIDGNPFSIWGYANGMTRLSQTYPFAEDRMFFDRAATSVLQLAL